QAAPPAPQPEPRLPPAASRAARVKFLYRAELSRACAKPSRDVLDQLEPRRLESIPPRDVATLGNSSKTNLTEDSPWPGVKEGRLRWLSETRSSAWLEGVRFGSARLGSASARLGSASTQLGSRLGSRLGPRLSSARLRLNSARGSARGSVLGSARGSRLSSDRYSARLAARGLGWFGFRLG
uniref:Uncharacterized protein n=1 Tax=Cucumis melo TaxID=3656 RepID=A0A9I9E3Q8_CUCME